MGSNSAGRAQRSKKRLPCTLVIEGNRLAGIVLDLSASGLFVQTSANPSPGARVDVELEIPGEAQRALLVGRVARTKVVPPRLKGVVHGGLGLHIESAPETFFHYLAQLQAEGAVGEPPAESEPPAKAPASASAAATQGGSSRGDAAPASPAPPRLKRWCW